MLNIIRQWFTQKDNATYSLTKLVGIAGAVTMIVQFVLMKSVDFQGLGIGLTAVMGALAAKYFVEGGDK